MYKTFGILASCAIAGLVTASPASAANFITTVSVPTLVGSTDFHSIFTGTGGSVNNVNIITDPGGAQNAGTPVVTGGNSVNITWNQPIVGNTLQFSFITTSGGIQFNSGSWTPTNAAINPATVTTTTAPVPEPSTVLSTLAIGAIGAGYTFKRNLLKQH